MTTNKPKQKKLKKVSISLSEREADLLQRYAKSLGTTKGMALKKLMKNGLREFAADSAKPIPQNQLGLFDAVQTDIFCFDDSGQ